MSKSYLEHKYDGEYKIEVFAKKFKKLTSGQQVRSERKKIERALCEIGFFAKNIIVVGCKIGRCENKEAWEIAKEKAERIWELIDES